MDSEIEYILIELDSISKILYSYLQQDKIDIELQCLHFLSDNLKVKIDEINNIFSEK